jgi:alpha-D-ribose 1-methylphosphonate 5-triphosphate synthase subunit PhnH
MQKGFQSETFDSQAVFRQVLEAMANPGKIMKLSIEMDPPEGIDPAAGAALMMLLDFETPLWSNLDHDSAGVQWLRFHTGTPFTRVKKKAAFALCTDPDRLGNLRDFNPGTSESPQESTTLIVQTERIDESAWLKLTGPGIQTHTHLKLTGLPDQFIAQRAKIFDTYPLGVDMIFVCGTVFVAIPRTTLVEIL